jgi:hypothetical protein
MSIASIVANVLMAVVGLGLIGYLIKRLAGPSRGIAHAQSLP